MKTKLSPEKNLLKLTISLGSMRVTQEYEVIKGDEPMKLEVVKNSKDKARTGIMQADNVSTRMVTEDGKDLDMECLKILDQSILFDYLITHSLN
jgi:hypothetical protein